MTNVDVIEGPLGSESGPRIILAWVTTVVAWSVLIIFAYRSIMLLRPGRATKAFQYDFSMAIRSSLMFLGIPLFLLIDPLAKAYELPRSLTMWYKWVPLWYGLRLRKTLGGMVSIVVRSSLGVFQAYVGVFILNALMPGGAAKERTETVPFHYRTQFPYRYNEPLALLYICSFFYAVLLSPQNIDTKRNCLSVFSALIVLFMQPDHDVSEWCPMFFIYLPDNTLYINPDGEALCLLYSTLASFFMAALVFLPRPPCFGRSRSRGCIRQVEEEMCVIANGMLDSMRFVVAHFLQKGTRQELVSIGKFLDGLESDHKRAGTLLEDAWWEILGRKLQRQKLQHMLRLSDLLRQLHIVLLTKLSQVHAHGNALQSKVAGAISAHMETFLRNCENAVQLLVTPNLFSTSSEEGSHASHAKQQCVGHARGADAALVAGLNELAALRKTLCTSSANVDDSDFIATSSDHKRLHMEMAFLDGLREVPNMIEGFLFDEVIDPFVDERTQCFCSWFWRATKSKAAIWLDRDQHLYAFKHTICMMSVLFWSTVVRDYSAFSMLTYSFLLTSTKASLIERTTNRILGTTAGILLGNLPALFLIDQSTMHDKVVFHWPIQGPIVYTITIFVFWSLASFGQFETDSQWNHAFFLLAGCGGMQFLAPLQAMSKSRSHWRESLFKNLMDTFVACLLSYFIDAASSFIFQETSAGHVAKSIEGCLQAFAKLLEDLSKGSLADAAEIQKWTSDARSWDIDCRKEDRMWQVPYKGDLVSSILSQCDEVVAATFTIQSSAKRCGNNSVDATRLLMKLLEPDASKPTLSKSAWDHAKVAYAALLQATPLDTCWAEKYDEGPHGSFCFGTFSGLVDIEVAQYEPPQSQPTQIANIERRSLSNPSTPMSSSRRRSAEVWQTGFLHVESSSQEHVTELAAGLAVTGGVTKLRLALDAIEVSLQNEAFWNFGRRKLFEERQMQTASNLASSREIYEIRKPQLWPRGRRSKQGSLYYKSDIELSCIAIPPLSL